jgi:hypothetical protein
MLTCSPAGSGRTFGSELLDHLVIVHLLIESRRLGGMAPASDGGFEIKMPKWPHEAKQGVTWVEHDLGQAVLALSKNYDVPDAKVLGSSYYAVSGLWTYPDLCDALTKAVGKKVTFVQIETAGMEELDLTVCLVASFRVAMCADLRGM